MMNSCTIVIPVYNEFKSLEILLEKINEISNQNVTFLIVDNGSTDPKVQEVLTRTKRSGWVQVRTEINQGFGGGSFLVYPSAIQTSWVGCLVI